MTPLTEIGSAGPTIAPRTPEIRRSTAAERSFADALRAAAGPVSQTQASVAREIGRLMHGEADDLHTVQIAMQKAGLQLQLLLQVRSKVMQAYQEIMQMSV